MEQQQNIKCGLLLQWLVLEDMAESVSTFFRQLEGFHFRWFKIRGMYAVFSHLDNAMFSPSKMKYVSVFSIGDFKNDDFLIFYFWYFRAIFVVRFITTCKMFQIIFLNEFKWAISRHSAILCFIVEPLVQYDLGLFTPKNLEFSRNFKYENSTNIQDNFVLDPSSMIDTF